MSTSEPFKPAWRERLQSASAGVRNWGSSWGILTLNAMLLLTTAALVLSAHRTVFAGLLLIAWGGICCHFAYHAGATKRLDAKKVILAYAASAVLLIVVLNGCSRMLGY